MKPVKPKPISIQAVNHRNYLAKMIEKNPDRINVANVLIGVFNLGYLDSTCRQILVDFTNHILRHSSMADGCVDPPLFGSVKPKPPKTKIVYKDRIVHRDRIVYRDKVIKEKPTLPPKIPVLTEIVSIPKKTKPSPSPPDSTAHSREAVSVPPKAIRRPKTEPRPEAAYHNRSALKDLVTPLQQSVSKQFRGGHYFNNGVINIRRAAGVEPPPGFKQGMLPKKTVKV
jgi:hypothetical protein